MKQLREQIKKEIHRLMEEKYPLPPELTKALEDDLKLKPLIRYVADTKAAATVPPSYEIFLTNGTSFLLIYEDFSLAVKIEAKKYHLGVMEELSLAKQHLNRLLSLPQIPSNIDTDEDTESEDADDTSFEDEAVDEPAEEPEA